MYLSLTLPSLTLFLFLSLSPFLAPSLLSLTLLTHSFALSLFYDATYKCTCTYVIISTLYIVYCPSYMYFPHPPLSFHYSIFHSFLLVYLHTCNHVCTMVHLYLSFLLSFFPSFGLCQPSLVSYLYMYLFLYYIVHIYVILISLSDCVGSLHSTAMVELQYPQA